MEHADRPPFALQRHEEPGAVPEVERQFLGAWKLVHNRFKIGNVDQPRLEDAAPGDGRTVERELADTGNIAGRGDARPVLDPIVAHQPQRDPAATEQV